MLHTNVTFTAAFTYAAVLGLAVTRAAAQEKCSREGDCVQTQAALALALLLFLKTPLSHQYCPVSASMAYKMVMSAALRAAARAVAALTAGDFTIYAHTTYFRSTSVLCSGRC
jgi:prophage antirepressor-like protein